MKKTFFISSAILFSCATHSIAQSNYKPIKKINVEGEGGWDLLAWMKLPVAYFYHIKMLCRWWM
jgi:hypothetical protein